MSAPARRWLELRVRARPDEESGALLASALVDLGSRAVEERDGWLIGHVEEPADADAFIAEARVRLASVSAQDEVEIDVRWQAHQDWAEEWKRGLDTRHLTSRIVVTPSWIPVEPGAGEIVIVVDPGMAFGNAEHGTTRGCLRLLDRAVKPGDRVLDVGAGSGILSVAAARLGAEVLALEGDPLAQEAIEENVTRNGVSDRVSFRLVWADAGLIASLAPRDGVVANIESGVLRPLLPAFRAALGEHGRWLILSGIPEEEWPAMRADTEAAGFRVQAEDADGAWRSGWFVARHAVPA